LALSISRKLNLVLPIDTGNTKIWIHSTPISKEIFESNYLLLTKTLSNLYAHSIGPSMAPRIAALMLRDTAREIDPISDISTDLLNEIERTTNVLMPDKDKKWQTIPFSEVKAKKLLDEDVISEVENTIIYFIVASSVHLKNELTMAYQGLRSIWSAEITSSNVTEFMRSLPTSTQTDNTGEKKQPVVQEQKASLVPS
jgi:hypothetical protein